ncbi:class I SAM-dependent methyltransferase [Bacillus sp. ISL-47]|uniref:SAM-dependent methyltransferase n=1 Tax=Bacillus sp. ISL-47 TaxID=2819130 RepID=UPI001BE683FD|nr:methyltransferase domain-containing protein [Bacillus sp. ISL-47]MBT2690153.1 class I SAM-dependent methyltransferase [Bacillus sp. ISL-47]MBT2709132.1 class I SAM-dependent methyltransferase [Pseudomonas sp. ISL-84]
MKESDMDELLNIETGGEQKGFHKSFHYHRYEPTPYEGLENLFAEYVLKSSDRVVDFGCGKGRLPFYVHHKFGASAAGVEMSEDFYEEAAANLQRYKGDKDRVEFQCCLAQEYDISSADNRFYFFNPFTVQIFMKVVNNILKSAEEHQREIDIILYYPSEDYIFYLGNSTPFEMMKEVGLGKQNENERFLVYRFNQTFD